MKSIIVVLALLVGGVVAAHAAADTTFDRAARAPEPAQLTTVVKSSAIVVGVDIASQTATSIIIDRTQMFRWVEVENWNPNGDVVCAENRNTISTVTAGFSGWRVSASTGVKHFDVVPGADFFCQSTCISSGTRVSVMRGR